ncbi:MAG TPA: low molecular weight protein-tyrosine-phosphatase [Solimonas sp.]|nr:low molecular weight protein-tyrosine-phosphatase [Solimonas sp.]
MFNRIIVVCTGNICRSPIGEVLLRQRLEGKNRTVLSAGIGALVGHPADPMVCELMAERGIDIGAHRAQQATLPLLSSMDLILTMDRTHSDWIMQQYPALRGRVHKFLKWSKDRDVADPYRLPREAFEKALADIDQGVEDWLRRL